MATSLRRSTALRKLTLDSRRHRGGRIEAAPVVDALFGIAHQEEDGDADKLQTGQGPGLTELVLRHVPIDGPAAAALGRALHSEAGRALASLTIHGNCDARHETVGDAIASEVAGALLALGPGVQLRQFSLVGASLGTEGAKALVSGLCVALSANVVERIPRVAGFVCSHEQTEEKKF